MITVWFQDLKTQRLMLVPHHRADSQAHLVHDFSEGGSHKKVPLQREGGSGFEGGGGWVMAVAAGGEGEDVTDVGWGGGNDRWQRPRL